MGTGLGISGRIAEYFLRNSLTPLIALIALLLGIGATLVTPREEEPQINVTMANVFVPFPGASARDVEALVARPAEQVLSRIAGIEHVYSVSRPGMAVITVQYEVGEDPIQALVRLYDTINSHKDWLSPSLGVLDPIVKPKGIDDVPIVTLTFHSGPRCPTAKSAFEMQQVARADRDRPQAHSRHARRGHHRRSRPRDSRRDGRRPHECARHHRPGPEGRAAGVERLAACGRPGQRQPRSAGADRHLHRIRRRREAPGGRCLSSASRCIWRMWRR
jgi:hypothetical protein